MSGDREGVPNALLEAMATGLPAVATIHGGIPEAATDGLDSLLVPEKSPVALADAILGLVGSPGTLERFSTAAVRSVSTRYGRETCLQALEDCYEEAINLG